MLPDIKPGTYAHMKTYLLSNWPLNQRIYIRHRVIKPLNINQVNQLKGPWAWMPPHGSSLIIPIWCINFMYNYFLFSRCTLLTSIAPIELKNPYIETITPYKIKKKEERNKMTDKFKKINESLKTKKITKKTPKLEKNHGPENYYYVKDYCNQTEYVYSSSPITEPLFKKIYYPYPFSLLN